MHVARSKVEAFGAGRRHDVCSIARQEQMPETHRCGDEASQRCDALLDRWSGDKMAGRLRIKTLLQLIPEPVVRPFVDMIVDRTLEVITAACMRTHRTQGKAAFVI